MLVAAVGLAGCNTTIQETFGMGKRSPDEFQVVRRAPLVLPPDYALRPPSPGANSPYQPTPAEQARQVLTGQQATSENRQSVIERDLLAGSGVKAEPGIREKLLEEATQLASVNDRTYLFILDFQRKRMAQETTRGDALDPVAESRRLREEGRVTTTRTGGTFDSSAAGQGS
ncbi:DUF3035 domain-containing protein [Geminicoccaceae bacterium 1502E]|nr:DUF3035 domain-containing protein [Geminicoccaceae bacterium 1502E]